MPTSWLSRIPQTQPVRAGRLFVSPRQGCCSPARGFPRLSQLPLRTTPDLVKPTARWSEMKVPNIGAGIQVKSQGRVYAGIRREPAVLTQRRSSRALAHGSVVVGWVFEAQPTWLEICSRSPLALDKWFANPNGGIWGQTMKLPTMNVGNAGERLERCPRQPAGTIIKRGNGNIATK